MQRVIQYLRALRLSPVALQAFLVTTIVVPFLVLTVLVSRHSRNIPYWDDFAFIEFAGKRGSDRVRSYFSQHNEHRIFTDRIVADVLIRTTGNLNFIHMQIVGLCLLFGLAGLMLVILKLNDLDLRYAGIIAVLVLSPKSWENLTWGMASIQNYGVIALSALAIFLWFRYPSWRGRSLALCFATLATFTSGTGVLVFPAILAATWLKDLGDRGGWSAWKRPVPSRSTSVWLLIGTGIAGFAALLYFFNFVQHPGHPPPPITEHPLQVAAYGLTFLGHSLSNQNSIVIGALILLICGLLFAKGAAFRFPVAFAIGLHQLISAAAATYARSGLGVEQAGSSRYSLVGTTLAAALLILALGIFPKFFRHASVYVVCLVLAFGMLVNETRRSNLEMRKRATDCEASIAGFLSGTGRLYCPPDPESQKVAKTMLEKAIRKHRYLVPESCKVWATSLEQGAAPRMPTDPAPASQEEPPTSAAATEAAPSE